MKNLFTVVAVLILCGTQLSSQTIIPGGNVNGNWAQSGNPYLINGNITVANNTTLVIGQGVEVIFQDYYTFIVNGNLIANGTIADSILFTVADTTGFSNGSYTGWGGITANSSNSSLNLNYCIVEYSKSDAIYIDDISSITLENSHLRYSSRGLEINEMAAQINYLKCTGNEKGIKIHNYSEIVTLNNFNLSHNKINGIEIYQVQSGHFYGNYGLIKNNGSSGVFVNSYFDDAYFNLTDVIIEGNGNDTTNGGGILAYNYVSLQNVKISNNKALNGGGIYSYGQGYVSVISDLRLNNSIIDNNIAVERGGGVYYNGYHIFLQNSIINKNMANEGGGAFIRAGLGKTVLNQQTHLVLNNLEVSQNNANNCGGGVYFSFFGPLGIGNIGYRNITHLSIADNVANNSGSGIYNISNLDPLLLPINIDNSIIWAIDNVGIVDTYSTFNITYSDIKGTWQGTANINSNPFFINPGSGNYHLGWINYPDNDYTKSPCIDTGDPLSANDPDGTIADIGAYYFDQNAQNQVSLDITVFLEGPFSNNQMNTSLNTLDYLPLEQPYKGLPWNHFGSESVLSIPGSNVVDWILVEIRKLYNFSNPDNFLTVSRQAAFLLNNGKIKDLDGSSYLDFHTSENDSLYVCIFHRNHLPLFSANQIVTGVNPISYNFSTGAEMAMGGEHVQNQLSTSIWGMIASDGNKDSQVNNKDKNDSLPENMGSNGYRNEDFNMDGLVSEADIIIWGENSGKGNPVKNAVLPFNCGYPFSDERDEQIYNTVQIGDQCWMAENLNIGMMIQGSTEMANNSIIEKYCFDNSSNNCNIYGGLYQWNEMMQYNTIIGAQGICPENWYIPSDGEWTVLTDFIGGALPGGNMKTTGTIEAGTGLWHDPNYGATNSSGFSALPAGSRNSDGNFYHLGYNAFLWSSSESTTTKAWYRILYSTEAIIFPGNFDKNSVFSVRCLHGEYINQPPTIPSNPWPQDGAIDQQLNLSISWSCYDPENDPRTYDIYFDSTNPPALVSSGVTTATYNPGALEYNNTYYWQIIAHDNHGNSTTGSVWSFTTISAPTWTCGDQLIDTRDAQSYPTVLIGSQCWMAKNLNIGNRIDAVNAQTNNSIIEKYCFNNNSSNCTTYGGLYQWNEAMQYSTQQGVQGICPTGWHLPTNAEMVTITNLLGGDEAAGGPLKQQGTIEGGNGLWHTPNSGATNSTQFTGLPAGYSKWDNTFYSLGNHSHFWSSYQTNSTNANLRTLYYDWSDFELNNFSKDFGFSVRCIKN